LIYCTNDRQYSGKGIKRLDKKIPFYKRPITYIIGGVGCLGIIILFLIALSILFIVMLSEDVYELTEENETEERKNRISEKMKQEDEEMEEAYEDSVLEIASRLSKEMDDFETYSQKRDRDKSLDHDDDFVMKYTDTIVNIDYELDNIEKLDPPIKYEDVHEELLKAVENYRSIYRDLPRALDDNDVSTIERVHADIEKGNEQFKKATKMLSKK